MPPRSSQGRGGAAPSARGGPAIRGGPALRGGPAPARGSGPAIADHIKTVGVRRPGYGTGGRVLNTIVNAFAVDVPDNIIHHYDVVNPDKLPARVNLLLFQQLSKSAPKVFYDPVVYDGRKNAYAMEALNLGPNSSASFDVTLPPEGDETPASSDARPPKVYKIKLTKVAEINTEALHQFIQGRQSSDDSAVSTSLTALNVAIRMQPNLKYPFNSRSFFTETGKKPIAGGLELWRGYFQSIRPTQNRMYVNVDVSTGIMYKPGPLIALVLEYLGIRDPKMLGRIPEHERIRLQRFISSMRITTKHTGRIQARVIKRVTAKPASELMFQTREGQSLSVATYFKSVLGRPLSFPNIPCVEIASGALIPLELCDVPSGQIMRKQIPPEATSEIVEFSKQLPSHRLASIRTGLSVLQYGQSEYVRKFGINVAPNPMTVKARVLNPPILKYGDASREKTIKPINGSWNMRDKKLYKTCKIDTWVIVIFDSQRNFNDSDCAGLIDEFRKGAQSVGITLGKNHPLIFYRNPQQNIGTSLREAGFETFQKYKSPPNLMVVLLPEGGNQIYTEVKHFGDITMGVTTQCLKLMKCKRANAQYWANVMLKVNVKMGGINSILDGHTLNDPMNPTIVMGADVIHPAPGADGRPSFTSLVCSVDSNTAKYVSTSAVQKGRQEIIEDLQSMVEKLVDRYLAYGRAFEKGRRAPTRLVFYRDGVSEGQFQQVLDHELPAIKKALVNLKINPKVTLVVVGKRHHIRMFPGQPGDGDRTGNCLAGTTIDEGLGHPTEFDYYQLSHGGLLGTSRPAHYSVIYDDNHFNADSMQNLSYALCHVYARATRSVSIPAPVYYADIVCSRSKNHFAPGVAIDPSDNMSSAHTSDTQLARFKSEYKTINAKLANEMYFM